MKSILLVSVNQVFKTRFTIRDSKETSSTLGNYSIVIFYIPLKAIVAGVEFVHFTANVLFDCEGWTVSEGVVVFFDIHVDVFFN
jgi:hypothetical protein